MAKGSTRMMLLARRAQLNLAQQGFDLLEKKRAALMQEMIRVVEIVMADAGTLQAAVDEARIALTRAKATVGSEALLSVALAAREDLALQVETTNVMGLKVPKIEQRRFSRSILDRGYAITGESVTIDEAAASFEEVIDALIRMAESELRLRRLVTEIQRTLRRLNALEHLLIPRLEAERDSIQTVLNERERSDHFRLKLAKRHLEKKHLGLRA